MSRSYDIAWVRGGAACAVREAILLGVLSPLMDLYTRRSVAGTEHLAGVEPPAVLVANHASHMDTPAILRALPRAWRRHTAVGAAEDYFYRRRGIATLVSLVFSTVPLQRKGVVGRDSTAPLDRLLDDRWSLLLFAEGTRSRDGTVGSLHSGAAILAAAHGAPIVPVFVGGTGAAMPPGQRWMRRRWRPGRPPARRPIGIRFGAPIWPREGEHRREVMERVRRFFAESGAVTTPDVRLVAWHARS